MNEFWHSVIIAIKTHFLQFDNCPLLGVKSLIQEVRYMFTDPELVATQQGIAAAQDEIDHIFARQRKADEAKIQAGQLADSEQTSSDMEK
jgi:hypothetical protein